MASQSWITDPVFWVIALPALAVSGVCIQMILSLFSCCGSFRIRGRTIQVTWWMIPAATAASGGLWTLAVLYAVMAR